jgi:hypothetical protein
MITVALLSNPGSRRRIPCPVADQPTRWVYLEGGMVREEEFATGTMPVSPETPAVDSTPHRSLGDKLALSQVLGHRVEKPLVWEGAAPPSKRHWLHLESVLPTATPPVVWGCLQGGQFPGESELLSDSSLAKKHLEIYSKLAAASGHPLAPHYPSFFKKSPHPPATRESPEPPPPGLGVGFFSWIREPLGECLEDGPVGRGWGRIKEEDRKQYHLTTGRNDPGMLRICGFTYATTEGSIYFTGEDEPSIILAGLDLLEKTRYTANIVVESVQSFKTFTLLRAASSQCRLPDWLIYPPGRCWLSGLSRFAPRGEEDPHSWIMRTAVSCGEKTCSRMIPEPGASWMRGMPNPSMPAKSIVSALVKSPYFQLGTDPAPDLLARMPSPTTSS